MELYQELQGLLDALTGAKVDYALCGGLAVAFHGYTRFTKDIDILVREQDIEQLRDIVMKQGFTFESGMLPFDVGSPHERKIYRMSKIEGEEVLTLDLLVLPSFLREVWEDREIFEWEGRAVQVVSRAGLGRMKEIAGRPQDLLDLEMLGLGGNNDREEQ